MNIGDFIFGIALIIATPAYNQNSTIQVVSGDKELGKNFADGSTIHGKEYIFPDRIAKAYIDTFTGLATIQLRALSKNGKWLKNTGNVVQYDLNDRRVLWSKKMDYRTGGLSHFNGTMVDTRRNRSYCLDPRTGSELWELKNDISHVDTADHIGIGYRLKASVGRPNDLEGVDLRNGNILWKRELGREYGWNDLFHTNDSTLIVVASGLHALDMRTGKGWDYDTETGTKDYSGTIAANAAGVALGVLTGMFVMSSGASVVHGLVSNALVDSSAIYFASKEQLVKLDKSSGAVLWKVPFMKKVASRSSIYLADSVIFMVNMGMGYMGSRRLDFGKPFFASYDARTGKELFFTMMDEKDGQILGHDILDKEVILVFKNKIKKYSMETGAEVIEKEFPKDGHGELQYFLGKNIYTTMESGEIVNLYRADTTKIFVYTDQNKMLSMDEQLNITSTIDRKDLSFSFNKAFGYTFIAQDKHTLIVDGEGKRMAEVGVTQGAILLGRALYHVQDRSLIAIDLNGIIANE